MKKHVDTETAAKKKDVRQKAYLTKRLLVSAAKRGIREAAKESMAIMGYVVIAKDGWVIRKNADGTIEKITPIKTSRNSNGIKLD